MSKWLNTAAVMIFVFIMGCDDTTSTAIDALTCDGFIKGNVTSSRYDGRPLTFSFDHSMQDDPTTFYPEDGNQTVWIERTPDFEANWNGDHYSELGITLDSLDQDTVAFYYGYIGSLVPVAGDTIVDFGIYTYGGGRILTYNYDPAGNTISGTYTFSGNAYNGQPTTVTGSFQSKVRLVVNKPVSNNN